MPPKLAAMCTQSVENFFAAQKECIETPEHADRNWGARLEAEAELGSDFAARVASVKAVPEAAAY
jgi:hypothetical protein